MPSFHMGRMLLFFGFSMLLLGLAKPATPCLPPDPDLYAILLSEADGAITAARAKIKATGSEHFGAGELRAQLRYQLHPPAEHKKFHYAVSTSVRVDGLSNDTATQVEFDFSQALIPGGAFHLTLKIFYQEDGAEVPLLISEYRPKQLRKEMSEILVPDLPPLQGSVIVWGPATFFREPGKPKTERVSIPISDPTGSFILRLANGAADGEKRVSSASIRLNGRDVFKPCEFNQRARELSRQVTLLAGENLLEVKLKSAPGAQVTLELFRLEKSGCSALEVHTFMRNYGKPVVKEEIFELSPEITGPFTLNLFNGDPDGERRVDSAVISLNGQRVFSPRDFNERTGILSQIVSLKEKNTLRVELRGAPGDFLSLGITGYDHTPPKVEITGPGEGAIFTASPITVTGTVNDLLSSVKVNGIAVPVSADGTFVLEGVALQEGENQIRVVAVDPCGNEGEDQISVSLRNSLEGPPLRFCTQFSMPTIARAMEAEEEECRTQAYTWGTGRVRGTTDPTSVLTINGVLLPDQVEVSDQGEIAYAFRDGGSFSASLNIPEEDGVYPFTAVATNTAGGRTEAIVIFVRDRTAPKVVITSPPDGWVTKNPTVTVTGTVDDPQATVWWYYDAPPIPVSNGSFIVEIPLYEGENGIGISAYDEIWNQGFASIRVFWDTIPPQINIANLAEGAAVNNAILTVTGRVVDETPDTVTVMVNGETPQSLTLTDSDFGGTLVLSPGPNSLVFTATDRAGNISQVVRSIVLDTEPPTVAITSPASGAHVSGTLSVTIDAGDLGAGIASVALFVDGKTAGTLTQPPFTFSVNTALLAMGSHTITAVALDKAGNQSEATITVSLSRFMIEIVSPADSAIINKTQTMVRGRIYDQTGEIGVVVNGVLAVVAGSDFAAIIPLRVGRNTLTATATTAGGLQAQTSVTVNTERQEENILLRVYPGTGILSLTTNPLKVVFEAETYLSDPIISCAWDFNGDGIPEITGIDLKTVGQYQTPGLFFPRVTVIDNRGNIYSEIAVVNVLSREELDYLLRSKWEGMSGRLLEGDVDRAMEFFNESKREAYRRLLKRLSAHLPAIVSGMSDIQLIEYRDRAVFYDIQTSIKGEAYSFPLRFEKDINGIWKITSF